VEYSNKRLGFRLGHLLSVETLVDPTTNLRRGIVALLLIGLLLLMLEIRFEHREVLAERWETYIPLVYCAGMLMLGAVGLYAWDRWGRVLLLGGFGLAFAIGAFGLWLHSDGKPARSIRRVLIAWTLPPGDNGGVKPQLSGPPVMAPLAFLGLGSIGMIACARRRSRDH
jgi:hypothetical protein